MGVEEKTKLKSIYVHNQYHSLTRESEYLRMCEFIRECFYFVDVVCKYVRACL